MSFIDAIQFPFQDKNWVTKLAITFVCVIIPILGWLVLAGYSIRLIRNVQNNVNELPEYDQFAEDLTRGFMAFLGSLVYYIPVIIIACCRGVIGNSDNGGLIALNCLLGLAQFGFSLAIVPIVASAVARFAVKEDINVFFDFGGRLNDVTSHSSDALMLIINYFVLGIVGSIAIGIGLILCCIPGLIAIAAYYLASAHLFGQWSRVLGVGGGATGFSSPSTGTPPTIQPLS